jgi:hypothetical protein
MAELSTDFMDANRMTPRAQRHESLPKASLALGTDSQQIASSGCTEATRDDRAGEPETQLALSKTGN